MCVLRRHFHRCEIERYSLVCSHHEQHTFTFFFVVELDQTHEPLSSKDMLEWLIERVNESAEQIRSNEGLIALVLVTEDETQPTIVRALRRTSATVIVVSVVSNLVRLLF